MIMGLLHPIISIYCYDQPQISLPVVILQQH